VEAVKLLWKRKHFEEISWKRKRLTLYGAGSGSKKYSTASISLLKSHQQEKVLDSSPKMSVLLKIFNFA